MTLPQIAAVSVAFAALAGLLAAAPRLRIRPWVVLLAGACGVALAFLVNILLHKTNSLGSLATGVLLVCVAGALLSLMANLVSQWFSHKPEREELRISKAVRSVHHAGVALEAPSDGLAHAQLNEVALLTGHAPAKPLLTLIKSEEAAHGDAPVPAPETASTAAEPVPECADTAVNTDIEPESAQTAEVHDIEPEKAASVEDANAEPKKAEDSNVPDSGPEAAEVMEQKPAIAEDVRLEEEMKLLEEGFRLEQERLAREEEKRREREKAAKARQERLARKEEERRMKEAHDRQAYEEERVRERIRQQRELVALEDKRKLEDEQTAGARKNVTVSLNARPAPKDESWKLEEERLAQELEERRREQEKAAEAESRWISEQKRLAEAQEQKRLEQERLAREEAERLAKEEQHRQATLEAERMERERLDHERLEREKLERERREAQEKRSAEAEGYMREGMALAGGGAYIKALPLLEKAARLDTTNELKVRANLAIVETLVALGWKAEALKKMQAMKTGLEIDTPAKKRLGELAKKLIS